MLEDNLKAVVKPQYVDQIPRAVRGPVKGVKDLIKARTQLDNLEHIMDILGEYFLYYSVDDIVANIHIF